MDVMTEVAFHFNIPDKQAYACRLLRKAVGGGARVVVVAPDLILQLLDRQLWTFSQLDFIAHARLGDDPKVVAASAVILSETTDNAPHQQVLLNLGDSVPEGFEKFERVIDIVSLDERDRQLARARWKHFTERGYTITRHDIQLKAALE
jgi:DNA polymerase-3 subunit chi